ncbi:DUF177 domain-containing protein [Paenibacillus sp. IB182496]|uniref:DUF177 domain-containing protein n=1 Tax=Paenibacillus sabuli TaxID=2772509 RepID=A0A927BTQ5_9BACL|nr:DUF177 domain-containing protein [Paenibacillus sabuli]MBD2846127.1 DUF177 domain-containing protein [Paenibacillus sabuli]
MNLRIQELIAKDVPVSFEQSLPVDKLFAGNREVREAGPLQVRLTARPEDKVAVVEGDFACELEMACSRCLEPARVRIEAPFEEHFRQGSPPANEDEQDADVEYAPDGKVNLVPYVEEALLLHLPFVPLCSDNCKGLCPQCGHNLNEGECGCSRERIDPRLAGLKDLFKE